MKHVRMCRADATTGKSILPGSQLLQLSAQFFDGAETMNLTSNHSVPGLLESEHKAATPPAHRSDSIYLQGLNLHQLYKRSLTVGSNRIEWLYGHFKVKYLNLAFEVRS